MKKRIILTLAALLLCILAGVGTEGLCFAAAAWFAAFPRFIECDWYYIVIGALASSCAVILTGDSPLIFWVLLLSALAALSLYDLKKTVLLGAAAWLMLHFNIPPLVYVSLFVGLIYNAILVFTYEKICGTIKVSQIEGIENIGKEILRQ